MLYEFSRRNTGWFFGKEYGPLHEIRFSGTGIFYKLYLKGMLMSVALTLTFIDMGFVSITNIEKHVW